MADTVWEFNTARFRVALEIEQDYGHQYAFDDDGETQRALDAGEYVAFDSSIVVYLDETEIARNSLCSNVYSANNVKEFWTAHRDSDAMNRNCTIMRGQHPAGPNVSICHYFPSMVSEAISEARKVLCERPKMRCA